MRRKKWYSPALKIHAEKAREYLAEHKTVEPRELAKALGVGLTTTYSAIQFLNHKTFTVWTVNPGKDGTGGGWELATETVSEL